MSELDQKLRELFLKFKPLVESRLAAIETGIIAAEQGSLSEDLRAAAEREAHKLAGALGSYGLSKGTDLARELEQRFIAGQPDAVECRRIYYRLRSEIDSF
jgi:HPt (histidine-containing phosphotransfer) domain-containing protein